MGGICRAEHVPCRLWVQKALFRSAVETPEPEMPAFQGLRPADGAPDLITALLGNRHQLPRKEPSPAPGSPGLRPQHGDFSWPTRRRRLPASPAARRACAA